MAELSRRGLLSGLAAAAGVVVGIGRDGATQVRAAVPAPVQAVPVITLPPYASQQDAEVAARSVRGLAEGERMGLVLPSGFTFRWELPDATGASDVSARYRCSDCGAEMVPSGACFRCANCGALSGRS